MTTAAEFVRFAEREAHQVSPIYERLCLALARDEEILALLDSLPRPKRQPNLLLAVCRLLDGPVEDPPALHDFVVEHWPVIEPELMRRATQTNEPGRCAALLPVLASLPQPLALIEVGTSAGLCLYSDRYSYRYGDEVLGDGGPTFDCALTGRAAPTTLPQVVFRAGIDLNPLHVDDPTDLAWLMALTWPEHEHRRQRLRAAAAVAAADPPLLVRGDLVDELPAVAALAPDDATLVVFHSSVLNYVPEDRRRAFAELVRQLPGHWVSNEAPDVVPVGELPEPPDGSHHNVLSRDGVALAWTRPHGQGLTWFGPVTVPNGR
jgi:hypothetical protein